MNHAYKPDSWTNEKLSAAKDEEPDAWLLQRSKEKQDAANEKPDGDEEIVKNACDLIATSNYQLIMAEPYNER